MMFLLDTNVISELRKVGDRKADTNVCKWLSHTDAASFYVSAVTIMELQIGVLRVQRRDPLQGKMLRTWFDTHVLPEFSEQTLSIDATVALCCARLHVPNPCAERDRPHCLHCHCSRDDCCYAEHSWFRDDGCSSSKSLG